MVFVLHTVYCMSSHFRYRYVIVFSYAILVLFLTPIKVCNLMIIYGEVLL